MPDTIKISSEAFSLMVLFQKTTGAMARDCIIDNRLSRIIFVVNKGEMGLAIGKNGQSIKDIQKSIGKTIELVEYSEDPKEFILNALNSKFIDDVKIDEHSNGKTTATIKVVANKTGAIVGREGRNAEKARIIAKRYFEINKLKITNE
ncbi:MAG: NusA-like transcription termination signal-binding factor [Thaumarchaeota archaeon]|nr:NusA-like transcription termination signal-binding factor [Nitrososphaerota archaeon]